VNAVLMTGAGVRIALGGARWSLGAAPDERSARETLLAALEAGVRVIDTAPAYTTPPFASHNEHLIGAVLHRHALRDQVQLITKCGHTRDLAGAFHVDARPETIATECRASLTALRREQIDLYLLHWPDPAVPLVESVGALVELRDTGLVAGIGVCNVSASQLNELLASIGIDAVENRLSLLAPADLPTVEECERAGVVYLAYSPLGGPKGAAWLAGQAPDTVLGSIAADHGVTPQQIAVAWLLGRSPAVVAIIGAGRPESITAAVRAAELTLSGDQLVELSGVQRSAA
jgi:aryl-alcohol dehydrogenase-like predicted oxidoreductase